MKNQLQKVLQEGMPVKDVCEKYSLTAKPHPLYPNLIHFSYSIVDSPLADPVTRDSRGTILDSTDNWSVICWGFRKFFNYNEANADKIDWKSAKFFEKRDGTLCMVWHYDNAWHVSTTGTPDAGGQVGPLPMTFKELFWQTAKQELFKFPEKADKGTTYLFELTSPYNRIVVCYKTSTLTYLGHRMADGNETYSPLPLTNEPVLYDYDIDSALNTLAKTTGSSFEGFVVVDKNWNRVKIKGEHYLLLHRAKDGVSRSSMIELVLSGEGAEFLSYFPEYKYAHDEIKLRFGLLIMFLEWCYESIKEIKSQKDFALEVLKLPIVCKNTLFEMRKGVGCREALCQINHRNLVDVLCPEGILPVKMSD